MVRLRSSVTFTPRKEAQRLAREDGVGGPATVAALSECSPSLLDLLVGFVEDLAAQRGES